MTIWVLLRGWAREARHWGGFPAELCAAIGNARTVALDLPGNGAFRLQRSPSSIAPMVEHSRQALRAQGVDGPYYLVGLSLGGMVGIEWARIHPAEVSGCVLLNTSLRPFAAFYERLRPRNYATLLRLALLERNAQAREAAILRLTSAGGAARPELLEAWTRYAQEWPVARANVLRQLVAAARYRAAKAAPPVPILVLAARRDALVDANCSSSLARHWKVPVAVHPTAGHDLPLDDGPWVAAQIQRWLRPT